MVTTVPRAKIIKWDTFQGRIQTSFLVIDFHFMIFCSRHNFHHSKCKRKFIQWNCPLYDFVPGHNSYCSKWKAKFHKVKAGRQTFAESVAKHTPNSKPTPRGRDGDSTDGLISVTPPCNGPWIHLPTSGFQGANASGHTLLQLQQRLQETWVLHCLRR